MERVTIRIPTPQVEALDELADDGWYANRSEAIRSGVRKVLESRERQVDGDPFAPEARRRMRERAGNGGSW